MMAQHAVDNILLQEMQRIIAKGYHKNQAVNKNTEMNKNDID